MRARRLTVYLVLAIPVLSILVLFYAHISVDSRVRDTLQRLESSDVEVRRNTVAQLKYHEAIDIRVLHSLRNALDDEDSEVRLRAAEVLLDRATRSVDVDRTSWLASVSTLTNLMKDDDWGTRGMAAQII